MAKVSMAEQVRKAERTAEEARYAAQAYLEELAAVKAELAAVKAAMKAAERSVIKVWNVPHVAVPLTREEGRTTAEAMQNAISNMHGDGWLEHQAEGGEPGDGQYRIILDAYETGNILPQYPFFLAVYSYSDVSGTSYERAWGLVPVK